MSVINIPLLGSFPPFSKSPFVPRYTGDGVESLPYCNVSYIKRVDSNRRLLKAASHWCMGNSGKKVLFFYNFHHLDIVIALKKRFPDIKAVLLVTDLPEYSNTRKSIFSTLNEMISPTTNQKKGDKFNYVDGYVLLAEGMAERLPIGNKPWILMEGIYNDEVATENTGKDMHKTIMYTGNLGRRYGIDTLLDAFSIIADKDYRLWIRGNGEMEDEVRRRAEKDNRIVCLKRMSRKELTECQQRATLMINPVSKNEEFTKYFFPSKTLEYMASGTPTLMARLECMPKEYDKYLLFLDDDSAAGMAQRIQEICSMPQQELNNIGAKAARFIFENKSPKIQMASVMRFFENI